MRRSTLGTITTISGDFYERGARVPIKLTTTFAVALLIALLSLIII